MKTFLKNILAILLLLTFASCGKKGGGSGETAKNPVQVGQNQGQCGLKVTGRETLSQYMIIGAKAADCGLTEEQLMGLTP